MNQSILRLVAQKSERSLEHTPRDAIGSAQHDDICPITFESAAELGQDAFISAVDHGRLYSAPGLREWLDVTGRRRARTNLQPLYLSPITQRDMVRDAAALGLPIRLPPPVEHVATALPSALDSSLDAMLANACALASLLSGAIAVLCTYGASTQLFERLGLADYRFRSETNREAVDLGRVLLQALLAL